MLVRKKAESSALSKHYLKNEQVLFADKQNQQTDSKEIIEELEGWFANKPVITYQKALVLKINPSTASKRIL